MFKITKSLSITLLTLLTFAAPARAYWKDYIPAELAPKLKRFPQKLVAHQFEHDWKCEVTPGVTAENIEGEFTLHGFDKQRKAWTMKETELRYLGGSCFTADVDANGFEDVVFFFNTGACGIPFYAVTILFFDENGVPHRDEAVSRFSVEKNGIEDLLQNPDGKGAYLLVQDLTQSYVEGKNRSYWRFSMMRCENCKLVDAPKALGMQFPKFVYFTTKPNHMLSRNTALLERDYQKQSDADAE